MTLNNILKKIARHQLKRLQQEIQKSLNSGDTGKLNMADIKVKAKARMAGK